MQQLALGFFDDEVPIETRRTMVVALKNRDRALGSSKRFSDSANPQEMSTRGPDEFVTKLARTFFDQLEIQTEFLDQDLA